MNETCRQFVNLLTTQETKFVEALEVLDEIITHDLHDLISMQISEHISRIMNVRRATP